MKLSRLSNRQLRRLLAQGEVRFGPGDYEPMKKEALKRMAELKNKLADVRSILFDIQKAGEKNGDKGLVKALDKTRRDFDKIKVTPFEYIIYTLDNYAR